MSWREAGSRDGPRDEPRGEFSELEDLLSRSQFEDPRAGADPAQQAALRTKRKRRRITTLVVFGVIVAALGTYIPLVLLAPVGSAEVAIADPTPEVPGPVQLVPPQGEASMVSLSGVDGFPGAQGTNGVLVATGDDSPRPMASISKLVTAMVILEAKPVTLDNAGPTITFSKADADLYDKYYVMGATVSSMRTGTSMSQRDALRVMLIASASNYAEALSTWAFGSQARFHAATKSWLAARNLGSIRMVEPTGVDARNVSSPSDLLALGRLVMADPLMVSIVATPSATINNVGIVSTNNLLGVEGIDGIKTGTLGNGSNLLYSGTLEVASPTPITVLGVVLGGGSREGVDASVRALLASIRSGFHDVPLFTKGDVVGTYSTPWGDSADIVAERDASMFTWSDTPITSTVTAPPLTEAKSGTEVGSVDFTAGTNSISVQLLLDGEIEPPTGWWRLTHPFEVFGGN